MQTTIYNYVDRLQLPVVQNIWQGGFHEAESLEELARIWAFVFGRPGAFHYFSLLTPHHEAFS